MASLQNTTFIGTNNTLVLPSGTTAERPASPSEGMIRYNTTLTRVEVFVNNAWEDAADPISNTKLYLPLFGTADGDITDTVSGIVGTISGGTRNYDQSSSVGWRANGDSYIDIMTPWLRSLDGNPFWTVEFWLYDENTSPSGTASTMFEFCHYTRGILYRANVSSGVNHYWRGSAISFANHSATTWQHHALVGYGSNIKHFIDGTQVADTMNAVGESRFANPITTGGHDFLRIGRSSHSSGQYTNGTFRKFKVSNRARYLSNFTASTEYPR